KLIIMYITSFIISFLIISNDWVYIVPICIILCRKCFTYTGISVTNPHIFILSAIITKFFKSTVLLCFNKSFISHFYTSLVLTFYLVFRYYLILHLIVWDDSDFDRGVVYELYFFLTLFFYLLLVFRFLLYLYFGFLNHCNMQYLKIDCLNRLEFLKYLEDHIL